VTRSTHGRQGRGVLIRKDVEIHTRGRPTCPGHVEPLRLRLLPATAVKLPARSIVRATTHDYMSVRTSSGYEQPFTVVGLAMGLRIHAAVGDIWVFSEPLHDLTRPVNSSRVAIRPEKQLNSFDG
jgi:hypothetical protein